MIENQKEKQYEADLKKVTKFAEAFKKLQAKYPEVNVWPDINGYIFASIHRSFGKTAKTNLVA